MATPPTLCPFPTGNTWAVAEPLLSSSSLPSASPAPPTPPSAPRTANRAADRTDPGHSPRFPASLGVQGP